MWLGSSHVSPHYNRGATLLQDGVDVLAGLGFGTVRIWLSGNYAGDEMPARPDYAEQVWGGSASNLTQLAQLAPYVTVFSDPRIERYMLGAWTFATGIFDPWRTFVTPEMLQNEYAELYTFCVHLLSTYAGKDFILQTVESDWVIVNHDIDVAPFDGRNHIDPKMLDNTVAFYDARHRAVRDARAAVPGSTSRVFSCIETCRVLDNQQRVHSHVIPRAQPDMLSWTSYEAINDWVLPGATQESVEAGIVAKTTEAFRRMREALRKVQGTRGLNIPIIVGELGWPERHALFAQPGGFDAGRFYDVFHDTCTSVGAEGLVFWQLWDNDVYEDPPPAHPQRRCIYDENGDITAQGAALLARL
jgi:hypothetical protein